MYPSANDQGADPFGLFGAPGDPFAAEPSAAPAGAPPSAAPTGELNADGTPKLPQPGFVAIDDFNRVKTQLDTLAPLAELSWVGEAIRQNPELKQQLARAIFNNGGGAGAPPAAPAAIAPPVFDMSAANAKIAAGDLAGALEEAAKAGAMVASATTQRQIDAAGQPLMALTAQNTIQGFMAAKLGGPGGTLFAKVQAKFAALVAQTPQNHLASLAASGQLIPTLETAYRNMLGELYEQGYSSAAASGRLGAAPQPVPPYGAGHGGGPTPNAGPVQSADEDKDDAEFVKWAREKGISFTGNGNAIVGEVR